MNYHDSLRTAILSTLASSINGFLNNTNKKRILIEVCFVASLHDYKLYNAKFDEICKGIDESITGKLFDLVWTIQFLGCEFLIESRPV